MPPSRRIELTGGEDEKPREVEQNPHSRNKVRLRAQVLRLSGRGSNTSQIASYTGCSPTSMARDLDRWSERGLEGLADGAVPGNPPRITERMRRYIEGRLREQRTWNATQLARALGEELERPKKGTSEGKMVLKYPDEEGPAPPAPGENAPGVERKGKPRGHAFARGRRRAARVLLARRPSPERGGHKVYLDALASEAERAGEEVVVVLDDAPFHTAGALREREEEGWQEVGLSL